MVMKGTYFKTINKLYNVEVVFDYPSRDYMYTPQTEQESGRQTEREAPYPTALLYWLIRQMTGEIYHPFSPLLQTIHRTVVPSTAPF